MSWTYSVPSLLLPHESPEQTASMCVEAGIAALEGHENLFSASPSEAELASWRAALDDAGVRVPTFHLPFGAAIDPASFYETERRSAVELMARWIERSAQLGARIGVMHPSPGRYNVDVEGLDRGLEQLRKSCEDLTPTLKRLDYRIAIENMLPGRGFTRLGSSPEHFTRFTDVLDTRSFGFCLDTGHALISAGTREGVDDVVRAMEPNLVAYHLADNAGDRDSHLAPGRGLVDWRRVFGHARRLGFDGVMCIETPPFAPGPEYTARAWHDHVQGTAALAADEA